MQSFFSPNPWSQLALSVFRLCVEAQALIGFRLFRIATGGVGALPETARMLPEKAAALVDANRIAALDSASSRPEHSCAKAVRIDRKRVRGNQTRLNKPDIPKRSAAGKRSSRGGPR